MTTTTSRAIITEPGCYDGMPDAVYHDDPVPSGSLSSSEARRLLPPSCPAKFAYERDHASVGSKTFDFGHAAHLLVLGAGPDLLVVEAADWRTKAAQQQRDDARAAGMVPLLEREYEQVREMAEALRRHPAAAALFEPGSGRAEQSLFWVDQPTEVWRRARLDWLRHPVDGRRLIIPDYKTCVSADPEHVQRAVYSYGYHQQAAWYLDGATELGLGDDPAFVFVFQEKDPPYLVNVIQLDPVALRIGRELNRQAIDLYVDCVRDDRWPGYSEDIDLIPLPAWAENRHTKEIW